MDIPEVIIEWYDADDTSPVLPDFPSDDGTYFLQLTVSEGEGSLTWEEEEVEVG